MLVEIEEKFVVHSQPVSRKFVVRLVEGQSPSTQIQDDKFFFRNIERSSQAFNQKTPAILSGEKKTE